MEKRYILPKGMQEMYLLQLEKISGLSSKILGPKLGVVGRSYRDWKREKYGITHKAADVIEKEYKISFPYSKDLAYKKWLEVKKEAGRVGGYATFKKYGSPGTYEGRSKGGRIALSLLRQKGIIPEEKPFFEPKTISEDLVEFIGILLGDGCITPGQWSITVNSIKDKAYAEFIRNLVERLFKFKPGMFKRKDSNALVIYAGGKRSIMYLQKLGLRVGNKVKQQVGVPEWIKKDIKWRIACIRGLIDTDGGIFLHSYTVNKKNYQYRKLGFANRSIPIIDFVFDTFNLLQLHPKKRMEQETKNVWLYNSKNVETYLKIVKTHNPRLLSLYGGMPEWLNGKVC